MRLMQTLSIMPLDGFCDDLKSVVMIQRPSTLDAAIALHWCKRTQWNPAGNMISEYMDPQLIGQFISLIVLW
jgi:hypothetical protein